MNLYCEQNVNKIFNGLKGFLYKKAFTFHVYVLAYPYVKSLLILVPISIGNPPPDLLNYHEEKKQNEEGLGRTIRHLLLNLFAFARLSNKWSFQALDQTFRPWLRCVKIGKRIILQPKQATNLDGTNKLDYLVKDCITLEYSAVQLLHDCQRKFIFDVEWSCKKYS